MFPSQKNCYKEIRGSWKKYQKSTQLLPLHCFIWPWKAEMKSNELQQVRLIHWLRHVTTDVPRPTAKVLRSTVVTGFCFPYLFPRSLSIRDLFSSLDLPDSACRVLGLKVGTTTTWLVNFVFKIQPYLSHGFIFFRINSNRLYKTLIESTHCCKRT